MEESTSKWDQNCNLMAQFDDFIIKIASFTSSAAILVSIGLGL